MFGTLDNNSIERQASNSSSSQKVLDIVIFLYSAIFQQNMFFFSSLGTKLAHKLGLTPPRPTEREVFRIDLNILSLILDQLSIMVSQSLKV